MTQPSPKSGNEIGRPRSFSDAEAFEAVLTAIKTHGYSQLTMTAVAKELGCTGPALMSRFGSKMGLLQAFIRWGNRLTEEHFEHVISSHDSPVEALRARFRSPEKSVGHEFSSQFYQLNILAFHVMAWSIPELHELELERRRIFATNIVAMLENAIRHGEIAGCDPKRLGRTMMAAIVGAALQWEIIPSVEPGNRVVEVIDELLSPYIVEKSSRP